MSIQTIVDFERIKKDLTKKYSKKTQREIAKILDVNEATLSKWFKGGSVGIRPSFLLKICKVTGYSQDRYILSTGYARKNPVRETFDPRQFSGVYAYDMPTGVTYIGKPEASRLEQACAIPTQDILKETVRYGISPLNAFRNAYLTFRKAGNLIDYNKFNKLEAIATSYLGPQQKAS